MRKKFFSGFLAGITVMAALVGCNSADKEAVTVSTVEPYTKYSPEEEAHPDNTSKLDPSLQNVYDKKQLVVGFDENLPPMSFKDENNEIVGFYVDVAQELCNRLEVELVKQPIDRNKPKEALNDHKVDFIWSTTMSTDPENEETLNISAPFFKTEMVFVIPSTSDIYSMNDLNGTTIGYQEDPSVKNFFEITPLFEDIKLSPAESVAIALNNMENGLSDTVFLNSAASNYYIKALHKKYTQLEGSLEETQYSVIFRKADITLSDELKNQFSLMMQEGKIAEISQKWFGIDFTYTEEEPTQPPAE